MSVLSKFLFSFGVGIIIITIAIPLMIGCVLLAQKILKDVSQGRFLWVNLTATVMNSDAFA